MGVRQAGAHDEGRSGSGPSHDAEGPEKDGSVISTVKLKEARPKLRIAAIRYCVNAATRGFTPLLACQLGVTS